jgi:hypothetical protein
MIYRKIATLISMGVVSTLSGCCSWCEHHCPHQAVCAPAPQYAPACCPQQPVCCPPGYQAPPPGYQQVPNSYQPRWSGAQPVSYQPAECCQ